MPRRHPFLHTLLYLLLTGCVIAAFWFGYVPPWLTPFSRLSLETTPGWFVDLRLASVRHDPAACLAVLKTPHIEASPVPDEWHPNRCGWKNGVRISSAGGARLSVSPLTCEMAAAMALWIEYELQPLAVEMFGQRVSSIEDMGTYDCRNIVGNPMWKDFRSQHAFANALDIGGFTLADGRRISVLRDWKGKGSESRFLQEAHRRACRYFRVALGPEFNRAHRNHFHFDRGNLWTCR
jgi:hypothetical protein